MIKCKICYKEYKNLNGISKHLNFSHKDISKQIYYDKFLKNKNDDKCIICNKKTKYNSFHKGYNKCCSIKCSNKLRENTNFNKYGYTYVTKDPFIFEKIKQTNLKKYGVDIILKDKNKMINAIQKKYGVNNVFQSKIIKEKIKQTNLKKFGVENPSQNKIIKQNKKDTYKLNFGVEFGFLQQEKTRKTNLKKFGFLHHLQNKNILQKQKTTVLKKYGVENISQSKIIKLKKEKTCLDNFGFNYPSQDPSIFEKIFKNSVKLKLYKNKNILYQGSYELDFLDNFLEKYPDIKRGPSIKYLFDNKNKVYHSDFIIPSLNLIIECKNNYLFERDKDIIKEKEKACIKQGYKWILILDKNYKDLIYELQTSN